MSFKIRRKWSSFCDSHYLDSFGNESDSFFAKRFSTREEAERFKNQNVWKHTGFSSDWEIIKD